MENKSKMSRFSDKSSNGSQSVRSPIERKTILRKIIKKAESLQEAINDSTISTLESCMEETDLINAETSIEEKIQNQEEMILDSQMMNISSKILRQCSNNLSKSMCSYDATEFAEKLVNYMDKLGNDQEETHDWSVLEQEVIKHFKTTAKCSLLLGALAPLEKKEITRRNVTVREVQAQVRRPENVKTVDKEKSNVEDIVKVNALIAHYHKTHRKPLDYFSLVLHPTDFDKTIENMLKVAFLVRDGQIRIFEDESKTLVVQTCSKEMKAQSKETTQVIQNTVSLTTEQWKMLKDIYRLEKPMIDFGTDE